MKRKPNNTRARAIYAVAQQCIAALQDSEQTRHLDACLSDGIAQLEAERDQLLVLLRQAQPIVEAHAGASHMLDGFRPRRNRWDELVEAIDAALATKDHHP